MATSELTEARANFTRLGVDGKLLADDEFVGTLSRHLLQATGSFAGLLKNLGISEAKIPEAFRWLADIAEREIDPQPDPEEAKP